eukprot:scaffold555065_cov42-Prasinocladus_malaysianus.AAC.1
MVPDASNAIPATLRMLHDDLSLLARPHHSASNTVLSEISVVIRMHPRNSPELREEVSDLCHSLAIAANAKTKVTMMLDVHAQVDNRSLCQAAAVTMSMGSTLGVESLAWGTAAAFYHRGWDTSRS